MSTITFDTLKCFKRLEASGIPAAQAEVFVDTLREALSGVFACKLNAHSDASSVAKVVPLDCKMSRLLWMAGILLTLEVAIFAKLFF